MSLTIEPSRFSGLPLITKATAENDYSAFCDGLSVGRIMLQPIANGAEVWLWTITGPAMVQAGLSSSGKAKSLEEARQTFRAQFDRWLAWAVAAAIAVHWHGGASRDRRRLRRRSLALCVAVDDTFGNQRRIDVCLPGSSLSFCKQVRVANR